MCGSPCTFETDTCGWKEGKPNHFDWTRFHGCTANSRTCVDATGNTAGMVVVVIIKVVWLVLDVGVGNSDGVGDACDDCINGDGFSGNSILE